MFLQLRQVARTEEDELIDAVWAAKNNWRLAKEQFNEVTEEAQIDTAIYQYLSAERRFVNLLMEVRSHRTNGTATL